LSSAKSMVLTEFNAPLEKQEYPLPEPAKGQLLVKIAAAGVCGSDAHMWRGKDPRTPLPVILGHEGVGWVAGIKDDKESVEGQIIREGDLILWHRGISCDRCYYCKIIKEPALCSNRLVYGINRGCKEPPHLRGGYSSHILLDESTSVFRLPPHIDPAVVVGATCSGSTAAHAFDLFSPRIGDTVLVQGPGPLGLFSIAFAAACGAAQIVAIGGTADRLQLCRDFGADITLNRNELSAAERREKIMELTDGLGVDYAVEAAGSKEAVKEGISLVRPGGTYLSVGFGEPAGALELEIFEDLVRKNLHLQGVWVSDVRHTYMALQLIRGKMDTFAKMITHRLPLERATEGMELMEKKEAVKVVLTPE